MRLYVQNYNFVQFVEARKSENKQKNYNIRGKQHA